MDYLQQIKFFYEKPKYRIKQVKLVKNWIAQTIKSENRTLTYLEIIFCSDEFLLPINKQYLNHDTYTDIITFPLEPPPKINGVIYISVDRVRENASTFKQPIKKELRRIVIHGILHLCGYGDKTKNQKLEMTRLEDKYLNIL